MLTAEERHRFAAWLEADAESDEQVADQLMKIGHGGPAMLRRADAEASRNVARRLRSTESMTTGPTSEEEGE